MKNRQGSYRNHILCIVQARARARVRPGPGPDTGYVPYMNILHTKEARLSRGSYLFSIAIPWCSRIAGRQVPKPRCLSSAANSLNSRIAGGQVPKPRCLSPAANSLNSRIAGRQVPKPMCLSPAVNSPGWVPAPSVGQPLGQTSFPFFISLLFRKAYHGR